MHRKESNLRYWFALVAWVVLAHLLAPAASGQVLSTTSILLGSGASSSSVLLTASGAWTATANDSWLHIMAGSTSGTGNAMVLFTVDANPGAGPRTGRLTVAGANLAVTQAGASYLPASAMSVVLPTGNGSPHAMTMDGAGNIYYTDTSSGSIKKYNTLTHAINTVVSGLGSPRGIARDTFGNLYYTDISSNTVGKWTFATQTTSTLVTGLSGAVGLAIDSSGNLYIGDTNNNAVKKWDAQTLQVTTLVGSGLNHPQGVEVDDIGNVYIADQGNSAVKRWNAATQQLATIAAGIAAYRVAVDGRGDVFIVDSTNNMVRMWNPSSGSLTPLVSSGLSGPTDVAVNAAGDVYVVDAGNSVIRKYTSAYQTAGVQAAAYNRFAGSGYVTVRMLPANTAQSWTASTAASWLHLTNTTGSNGGLLQFTYDANGTGATRAGTITLDSGATFTVTQAGPNYVTVQYQTTLVGSGLNAPYGIVADGNGNIYFTDPSTRGVKKYSFATDSVTTEVSTGLSYPSGLAIDGSGNIFIADGANGRIAKWSTTDQQLSTAFAIPNTGNLITTAVDSMGNVYYRDSNTGYLTKWTAATSQTSQLFAVSDVEGIAVDSAGTIYYANYLDGHVYKVPAGTTTPVSIYSGGLAQGLTLDGFGNIWFSDGYNGGTIHMIDLTTGTAQSIAAPYNSYGVAADPQGNIYFTDLASHDVFAIVNAQAPVVTLSEPVGAGSDGLPPVLPVTAPLTGPFAPTKDQTWLTFGTPANGVVNFSFTANAGAVRTGHVSVYGQSSTIQQAGSVNTLTKVSGENQSAPAGQSFASPLTVRLQDGTSNPISGQPVTFTVVPSGSVTGTFAATPVQPISTQADGTATSPVLTAGNRIGAFTVTAAMSGLTQTFHLTITQGPQTITFGPIPDQPISAATLVLSASASSGLPVTFASQTTNVCTVTGTTANLLALGTCTIQASQSGTVDFAAATPVTRSFNITLETQTITFGALADRAYGSGSFTVSATASSGLAVSFSSLTPATCTLSGNTVTLVAVGTCTIQATQAGNSTYSAATPATQSFTITKGTQTINFSALADRGFSNSTFNLNVTATSGLAVTLTSATPSVCTLSGATVTMVALGTCTIQASQAGDSYWNAASSVSQSFQINQGSQSITFGTLSGRALSNTPFTVSATASSGLPVSFASSTTGVCTVSADSVTMLAIGTCTIQASQAGNAVWAAATTVSRSFTITQGSQSITFGALGSQTFDVGSITVSATASSGLLVSFASTTTAVCTASGDTVTLVAVGVCTIRASQAGDSNWSAATPVNQSFNVTKGNQTISFGGLADRAFSSGTISLSATASSGLPVTFTSSTTGVCSVAGSTLSLVSVGTCTIQAVQSGNANWSPATSVSQSFVISQGTQTITFGPLADRPFGSPALNVNATASSGLPVSFSSLTQTVCTVSASTVSIIAAGTCTIQASQAGNANYAAATPVNQSFQVTLATQTITFGSLTNRTYGASPFSVNASASSGLPVSFNSQTPSVCTVSGSTVTLVGAGTCTIQATQAGDSTYAAATPVNQSFTVAQSGQTITFGTLTNQAFSVGTITLSATASSGLPVSFTSQSTPVCTVSGNTVTLISVGTCTIQATQAGDSNYLAATSVSRNFTVTKGSQTITFGPLSNQVVGVAPFSVSATASSGLPVSFSSLTNAICTVSGSTVTLVAVGTCTIRASQTGDTNWSAASNVDQSFQVTAGTQTITFGALSNVPLSTASITVSATASSGLAVSFSSLTTSVCTVSGSTVTLVSVGTCTIQASQAGNANYAAATPVSQSFQVTAGTQTITFGALSNVPLSTGSITVSATASSGLPVSFSSLTTPVCTVSGSTVTLVSAGTCTIQASQAGNANYAAAMPISQSFQVTAGTQTITFGALSNTPLSAGSITVSATASSGLPVSFASLTAPVCTVSGSTVTLVSVGTCTIQATQAGDGSYAAATPVSRSFSVTKGTQTITFGGLSNQALGSSPFGVSATASSGLPVSFTSLTTGVCTVSGSTVTLVAAGTCTIRASQAGDANWNAASNIDQSFQVTAGTQTITFGALSNVPLSTGSIAVSATASSGLPVSFASLTTPVCTVSGNTVALVSVGTCTIQASQAGNANYAAATPVSQSFQVTAGSQTITFGALSNVPLSTGSITVSASASSGLPVSFSSLTTPVCTVSGNTVALVSVGTCTIQASQAGNANYAAATPVSQSFQVTAGTQTITFVALSNTPLSAGSITVSATASSGLAVSFSSLTTAVCTVSGNTVTLVSVGTCTIQASQAGNANYAAATPVSQSFQVTAGTQTITFGALSNVPLSTGSITVSATASSGLPVSFASQTTPVCTVSGSTVTLVSVGTCTIQATQAGTPAMRLRLL